LSRKLPRVTGKQLCKIMTRHGFSLTHVRGRHHHFVSEDDRLHVTVPVHAKETLAPKTIKSILDQAELPVSVLKKT
jgi:predicted RNA binding protein YcfA (HicA-like mRNA interferase family)